MRVENLCRERRPNGIRVSADLVWEECEGPVERLYFDVSRPSAEYTRASAEAFAVACVPAAVYHGEPRVRLEGELCPRLHEGLTTVQKIFASWYDWFRPVPVEATGGLRPVSPAPDRRAACFLSGGIDSLALLRANRLHFPADHPAFFRDCIIVHGLNVYDLEESTRGEHRDRAFEDHLVRLQRLAACTRFELVPMYTNTRALFPSFDSWAAVGFGAGILSSAHLLSKRISSAWLASGGDGVAPPPKATHPLLDRHFSSAAIEIHHGHTSLSRLEKTRLVGAWTDVGRAVQVCLRPDPPGPGEVNCGECGKCTRTMLALLVDGRLGDLDVFPRGDVTPEMVRSMDIDHPHDVDYCSELLGPLREQGREDLAEALEMKLRAANPTAFGHATARRLAERRSKEAGTSGGSVFSRLLRKWLGR